MSEAPPPPDVPGENEAPDMRLALIVAITLLRDLDFHIFNGDGDRDDLRLRMRAVIAVLRRVRDQLGGPDGSE